MEAAELPLVSCIMPTADRRGLVRQAIQYFLRQDYPCKELVVLDDGREPVGDLLPSAGPVQYHRLQQRQVIGTKRNLACQLARGTIIVHWDDDDWAAPRRLSCQVEALLTTQADVCGLSRVRYYAPIGRRAWMYVYPEHQRSWVAGNTLCYRRSLWERQPFEEIQVGEDTHFLWNGVSKSILALEDDRFLVALLHPGNTSARPRANPRWRRVPAAEVQTLMGQDLPFYDQLSRSVASWANVVATGSWSGGGRHR